MIYLLRFALMVFYTVFWASIACVISLFDRSGESVIWAGRRWVAWILASCRVRVECEGADTIDREHPAVFMSNHQSLFDIPAIVATLPVSFRFVAKRELTRIPLFGWALVGGGHIIVDRSDRSRSVESLSEAAEQIRGGTNVIVFPEGTRSSSGRLRDFKSGGFHLAIEAGVPVIPVSISGSRRIVPKRSLRIESGTIKVRYGAPIPTEHLTLDDRGRLKVAVREAILAGLDESMQRDP